MAKQSGLGHNCYIGGYNLSGDLQALGKITGSQATFDVTDITQSGHARIGGRRDGAIDFTSYFDPATVAGGDPYNGSHLVLSALPAADVHVMYCAGTAVGAPGACMVAKQVNYDPTRGADGSLTIAVSMLANGYGLEWGNLLTTGVRTDTVGTAGTSYDQTTVSTAFGWQAYLQVMSVTGTSVTVTLEDSADNATWLPLTGGAFTAVAAPGPGTQRLTGASNATVRRYIRATTSGTFSNAQFAVTFVRNLTAVTF